MKRALSPHGEKRPWETFPRPSELSETTVALSDEEAAWVALESLRLMRGRRKEEARKRALHSPAAYAGQNFLRCVYVKNRP